MPVPQTLGRSLVRRVVEILLAAQRRIFFAPHGRHHLTRLILLGLTGQFTSDNELARTLRPLQTHVQLC